VRLAYIISAYKLPEQLRRLVETLATDTSSFVIHVDKKTDDGTYRRMVSSLDQLGNVHFLERHRSYYGAFRHVRATLKGIDELLRRQVAFDYAIGPDLSVLLSDFHVLAAGPDFMVFDLSRSDAIRDDRHKPDVPD
jgi:hypothetical protein